MQGSKDDRSFLDWEEVGPSPQRLRRRGRERARTRTVVLASVILGLLIAPFGIAATGDVLREGVRNGTTSRETEIIGKFDATTGAKGGYVTRQSNVQAGPRAGGAAIYGCRGAAGGTAGGSAPCLRASNLADGLAFEFAAKSGPAGVFEVGSAGEAPFATNGAGLVTNLNADKVDGLDAAQLRGEQGPAGPKGDTGATGAQGATGPPGPAGSDAASAFMARIAKPGTTAPAQWFGAVTGLSSGDTGSADAVATASPNAALIARDLFVRASTPYTTGGTEAGYRITLLVNGEATDLTCEFRGATRTCTSASASATVPAGSSLAFRVTALIANNFIPSGSDFEIGWRATTP